MLHPVLIGESEDGFHQGRPVYIGPQARRRHLGIFGTSGAGKSGLMRSILRSDLIAGDGVTVVDPHGQLVDDILNHHIPRHRTNDVVYFRPANRERPFALNLLHCRRPEERGRVVADVMSIFKKLWSDAWGRRMEHLLLNSLWLLIEQPTTHSILAIPELLTKASLRTRLLRRTNNPKVTTFFKRFERWPRVYREEAIAALINKCDAFLTDPMMRNIIGQSRTSIDFRRAMDNRKIILCDLSKGDIGADNSMLLGSVIVMECKLAALSRADTPESKRVPHLLFAEEAQNFIGDFDAILSETRKFNLSLAICTRSPASLPPEVASAIFTNAGNLITFRVANADAEDVRGEFARQFPNAMIQDLPDYHAWARLLLCDETGCRPAEPEPVLTYAPIANEPGMEWRSKIERASNERYTQPRAIVEEKMGRFLFADRDRDGAHCAP